MDAHDLFYQLTRGVRFTDKKQKLQKQEKEVKLKEEVPDIQENINDECMKDIPKDEPQSEEEDNAVEFQLIDGTNLAAKPKRKKKKTVLTDEEREKQQEEEMTNILRKENRLTVLGKNVPPPIQQFEELHSTYQLSERLLKNLAACNYPLPTPIQMQAIPIMMKGRHLMACAPTGSGKTIAFLTPVLNDLRAPQKVGFRALILAPTRELAQQIYRECVRLSEKTALRVHIISKVNQAEQKFGPNGSKKCDILISTPNRVRFLLQQQPPLLDLRSVEWFIIDEADRLMDDGKDNFKEQLDDIMAACTNPNKKIALFSATYTVPVSKWVVKHLKNVIRVTVGQQNAATEHVEQELLFVGSESGKLLAIRDMVRTGLKPPVLVFVQSKDRAKQLFNELLYDGINVDVIHADRTQQQRDNCVRAFREGHIWVLICTELMGRGIDFKGVNVVINYDFPPSTISYIHRIGRTGRAGRAGKAITFFTHDDTPSLRGIAEIIKNSGGKVPEFMLKLKKPRKTVLKTLKNYAPKREDISTRIKPEAHGDDDVEKKTGKSAKLEKMKKFMQRKRANNTEENESFDKKEERVKKMKKFNKIEKQLEQNGSAGKFKKQNKFSKKLKNDKTKLKNK